MFRILLCVLCFAAVRPFSPLRPNVSKYRQRSLKQPSTQCDVYPRNYPFSQRYYEEALKRLNSQNRTIQNDGILNDDMYREMYGKNNNDTSPRERRDNHPEIKIIIKGGFLNLFEDGPANDGEVPFDNDETDGEEPYEPEEHEETPREKYMRLRGEGASQKTIKSKNFEVVKTHDIKFKDVGGYANIKEELMQTVDLLKNYAKYKKYNVRIPKGLVLEGPPGNGKTLLAKALAGEANCGFIAVSGSDFQEKYVGVGASKIRELFELAKKNEPCIIFIDEIAAVGRKRSGDGETSSTERDSTLNALLVEMDGFKNSTGVFVVGATNRVDLLDSALMRPGRIDKKVYVGYPDQQTRESVVRIHIRGKPCLVKTDHIVDITDGLSCAQIENLLNEAMLHALRNNRTKITYVDIDSNLNKIIAGWQSSEHEFSQDMLERITVHEMGHAILGILAKHHAKLRKVVLNPSSPKMPGYTIFEQSKSALYVKEALFEHLMILLGGRIAEEVVYNASITTGAINDFEESLKLAERMVAQYGMGDEILYPNNSEKYKERIDDDVVALTNHAYLMARIVLENCRELIMSASTQLKQTGQITAEELATMIRENYPRTLDLRDVF